MELLSYKSDEMYSSTELIRKSKMIFDKVINKEIDKAIILRDGKPTFLLMEFKKYEKIMAEYEKLKSHAYSNKKIKETSQIQPIQKITTKDKNKINKIIKKDEKKEAPNDKQNINSNNQIKKDTEKNIKLKILQARKERAELLLDEKQNKEDLKEELILQSQLKEQKLKKDRELQEFWD